MSFPKKAVTTYAKSFFFTIQNFQPKEERRVLFDVSNVYIRDEFSFLPDIHSIGEELILLRAILLSSVVMKDYFKNPTYSDKQKLKLLFVIFPGLTIPVKAFLKILAERSVLNLIPEIAEEYGKILLDLKGIQTVKLVVASPLDESYGALLLSTLKKNYKIKNYLTKCFS